MKNERGLLRRPVTALCLCISLSIISIFIIVLNMGAEGADNSNVWSVTIKHYGIDAKEMERTVAIPLEDALSSIENIKSLTTSSENGSVRAYIIFNTSFNASFNTSMGFFKKKDEGARRGLIVEAAQRVYETLPQSAQRPEIAGADEARVPVWTAAVFAEGEAGGEVKTNAALNTALEKTVKPAFLALDGVACVELSGAGVSEIIVALNERALGAGISPFAVAQALAANDALIPAGYVKEDGREIRVLVDGRYDGIAALEDAYITVNTAAGAVAAGADADGSRVFRLGDICSVSEHEREPDIRSRLNGRKAALISVIPAGDCDTGKLSSLIAKEIRKADYAGLKWTVLSDRGAEEARSFRSVCAAALQGAAAVAILSFLLTRKRKSGGGFREAAVVAVFIPFICLLSAAVLSALGIRLSKIALAGISSGLGAAIDACLLCADGLAGGKEPSLALSRLRGELVSGSVTTAAALLPLGMLPFAGAGITTLAAATAAVTLTALPCALVLLPPLIVNSEQGTVNSISSGSKTSTSAESIVSTDIADKNLSTVHCPLSTAKKLSTAKRRLLRLFARLIYVSYHHPAYIILAALVITAGGVLGLALAGTDTGYDVSENSVYAHIEFEGGTLSSEIDGRLAKWAEEILRGKGIVNVQSGARTGSASALITFSPKLTSAEEVRALARSIEPDGGFVYISEGAANDRNWTISISGDETEKCKQYAKEFASICAGIPLVKETVLNFKEGGKRLTFTPNRALIAQMNSGNNGGKEAALTYVSISDTLRRAVHGPVAYKRQTTLQGGNKNESVLENRTFETDVRVKSGDSEEMWKKDVENLPLGGGVRLSGVTQKTEETDGASVRRQDRRRHAGITIRTKPVDARKVRDVVMRQLNKVELPPGYYAEFDRDAIEAARSLSKTVFYFLLALVICYMIIAAANESFTLPFIVLAVVPPSAAFSAIMLVLLRFRLDPAAACGFVAVCGIAVNAAVISTAALADAAAAANAAVTSGRKDIGVSYFYTHLRKRLGVLTAAALTTVVSALPFLFLREGANALVRTLAIITAAGVSASALFSVSLVPALVRLCLCKNKIQM
ncbi:MAG: efflux RND transporter permease subunit [Spirochaetaceae bacterium]|jgi:multidrug efflux pump subunit AcrB|nr:efflux RND transporter permease subunit [Spirochaetaceae bacterium]